MILTRDPTETPPELDDDAGDLLALALALAFVFDCVAGVAPTTLY